MKKKRRRTKRNKMLVTKKMRNYKKWGMAITKIILLWKKIIQILINNKKKMEFPIPIPILVTYLNQCLRLGSKMTLIQH